MSSGKDPSFADCVRHLAMPVCCMLCSIKFKCGAEVRCDIASGSVICNVYLKPVNITYYQISNICVIIATFMHASIIQPSLISYLDSLEVLTKTVQ